MSPSKVEIGKYYRLKQNPDYGYAVPTKVLAPRQDENPNNFTVVKCDYFTNKTNKYGIIKYFKLKDLVEE